MFVEDLKHDFYNQFLGQRVLVLVHADVDAVCACAVLQALFRADHIAHTVVCVASVAELQAAYAAHAELRVALLINCGGTLDLVELLRPPPDRVLFVLDWHRPSDVCNVYSDGQVRLVQRDPEEEVPDFDDIFRDEEQSEGETEAEESGAGTERGAERAAAAARRRRELRAWEQRRHTLMFNYTQFSYHGKPSGVTALETAWLVGRADARALWAGAVAAEAAAALCLRAPARALLDTQPVLTQHVARLRHALDDQAQHTQCTVSAEEDARLPLYRRWSLEAALRHAPALAPALRLHTARGTGRLRRLLAAMGCPLRQATQAYRAMDLALRRELPAALAAACAAARLPPPLAHTHVWRAPLAAPRAALDTVYTLMALLEDDDGSADVRLERALEELRGEGGGSATRGEEGARRRLEDLARAVHTLLAHRQLHTTGPFDYFIIPEGSAEARSLGRPLWLAAAARWAAACVGGASGAARPLLALASATDHPGRSLVVGLPPRHADEPRNLLGAAFEQAREECGCAPAPALFHAATALVPAERRTHFLDALTKLLA